VLREVTNKRPVTIALVRTVMGALRVISLLGREGETRSDER
jgi:hypothetical protein